LIGIRLICYPRSALLNADNTKLERFMLLPRLPFDRKVTVGLKDVALKAGVQMTDLSQFLALLEGMRIHRRTRAVA